MLKRNQRAEAVQSARRHLGLGLSATLTDIKEAYHSLARQCHPDLHPPDESAQWEDRMRTINAAYALLMDYCERYLFSFNQDIVELQCRRQDPFEHWRDQFMDR